MKLKSDAVPTIFDHRKPIKRRASSIKRNDKSAKRQILEEAFQEHEEQRLKEERSKTAHKYVNTEQVETKAEIHNTEQAISLVHLTQSRRKILFSKLSCLLKRIKRVFL